MVGFAAVGKKAVRHLDFDALVGINREVVTLTGETHGYSPADGKKLRELVKEVELRADNQAFVGAVSEKAALLVFKIASGQYFKAGNKRTALVAGAVFLRKNGYSVDIRRPELVSTVDRVGVAAASLEELFVVIGNLKSEAKVERKGWDGAARTVVDANRDFLTEVGS